MISGTGFLSKPLIGLGFNNLIKEICSCSHMWHTIDGSIKEISLASVSNNAVELILLMFSNIHGVTKALSENRLPGKKENGTINGSILLLATLAEVKLFPT